jgi:hypothetical protein
MTYLDTEAYQASHSSNVTQELSLQCYPHSRYRLNAKGLESRLGQEFPLLRVIQTGSGAHPTPYSMGTGGSFTGNKAAGSAADHSPTTMAEVKKT